MISAQFCAFLLIGGTFRFEEPPEVDGVTVDLREQLKQLGVNPIFETEEEFGKRIEMAKKYQHYLYDLVRKTCVDQKKYVAQFRLRKPLTQDQAQQIGCNNGGSLD